ncbi:penicillin-binding protein 2 [Nocardioides panacisoli]|uniref:peptidoglycan D,D-transpeptidase FtsI family protein n=1 Tax=Nocardioides panacisoli TaxID=627624 RepID=UPI001C62D67F|nr:penicillin-binding protein 2 [Nocardioides panacisoli]QYJ04737.1 penicillin-binding protein 2 [Nocardioides panacisoli]
MTRPRLPRRRPVEARLRIGFLVIAIVLSVFAARLVQLQGLDPGSYAEMAAAEGSVTVTLPATRGEILDRNGVALAHSMDGKMIVADPALTADRAPELATFLSQRLDIDYFRTLERLRVEDSRFQYIARQIPASKAEDVVADAEDAGFSGLLTEHDPLRTYPNGQVAASLVGFLGTPENDGTARALAGLEDSFDGFLAGKDGEARYQKGAGNTIPLGDNTVKPAVDGEDLQTTLDSELQWYAQRVLQQSIEQSGGVSGHAVVMDSRTGGLLALADYPSYDNRTAKKADEGRYTAASLTDPYEPGSVEKVLTAAALIDAGHASRKTKIEVPGVLHRQDRPIHDWWDHDDLRLTLAGVIAKSSNIGTVLASDQFADGELRRYLSAFGLGESTGVGLHGETRGILPGGSAWTSQVGDRVAFGQSLAVNAVQMTAAVNTIANGGVRVDPSLVQGSATLDNGNRIGTDLAQSRRVVSPQAAKQTMQMMEQVVVPDVGVAPGARVPGYRVAGKTGTAQRVDPECGCYDGSTSVSFAGFAPADDPRFTIYVVVHEPKSGGGGSVGGPAFSKLMSYTLRRYGVPPTGSETPTIKTEW